MRHTVRRTLTVIFASLLLCVSSGTVASVAANPKASDTGADAAELPKHFLTGYWHNFVNDAGAVRLGEVSEEYDLVAVAFGEATTTPGEITFGVDSGLSDALGGYTDDDLKADVEALHQQGKQVVLSVGGERGQVNVGDAEIGRAHV